MSANNVTVGIRLTVDGREVQGSLRLTQAELERLGDTSQRAAGDVQNLGNNTTSLVDKLKSYKNEILAIAAAYGAYKIGDYVKEATLLAARYETLGIVLKYAGNNAGYSSLQVDEYAKKLNQSGISMIKARESVIAMAAAQLDLNKAQELGRVAQNLAVVSGQNSSETLESLITNIQQADTEGLRFLGITLDQSKALQEYSKQHRISVEVLTARQKAEAILNAVIQDSTKYTGIYEGAMSTAGKAMTSLSRYVEDLQVKLGIPFLDSFAKGIFGVTNVLKGANAEMNRLHQNKTLESLGQALGVLTGGAINGIVGAFNLLGETIRGVTRIVNENKLAFIALATGASAALLYQLVPALIAVGHTAWLSMLPPVVAAFAKVVSVARSAAIAIA